jgi:thermitase
MSWSVRTLWIRLSVAVLALAGLSAGNIESRLSHAASSNSELSDRVPGEWIVRVSEDVLAKKSLSQQDAWIRSLLHGVEIKNLRSLRTDSALKVIRLQPNAKSENAIRALAEQEGVVRVEPNWIYRTQVASEPNDSDYGQLWGMKNVGQADSAGQVGTAGADINVTPVWQRGFTGSRKIVVAVIDSGVSWTHPDLVDNLYTNTREIPGNGIDDDRNGFVDDVHGWNFSTTPSNNNSEDDNQHGTHCAGTIGATGDNGLGVVGVNWEVSILPIKFLSAQGSGTTEGGIESVNYARLMGVDVMSNSWGGGGYSEELKLTIEKARDAGILFVAAAGNNGTNNDLKPTYPADYAVDNILTVGATNNRDYLATFSNFGPTAVDVTAPGVKILSTVPGGAYRVLSGTSMATPHVSGVAALLKSVLPNLTYADLKRRLIATSDPILSLSNKSRSSGRVNVENALLGKVPQPLVLPKESDWIDVPYFAESAHPYLSQVDQTFDIQVPGARMIRVVFDQLDLEEGFDKLWTLTPGLDYVDYATGKRTAPSVGLPVVGDAMKLRFQSDTSLEGWGFKVTKVQAIY